MNILVIGGAGYIGSFLSTELLKKGHFVTIIDKLVFGEKAIKHLKKNVAVIEQGYSQR